MLQIINCEQNSEEWYKARVGIATASNFASILAKGHRKMRRSYMLKLAAERITGEPMDTYQNAHMQRGSEQEPEAKILYADYTGNKVEEVGFIKNGNIGYSPDGLVNEDGVIEIKSKLASLHIECILSNKVPGSHLAQIQGALYVSNRQWCDFVSYSPGLPLFIKRVERDEEYISNLEYELNRFESELQEIINKIMSIT